MRSALLDQDELPKSADVVIVGAGIAGLGFARELAARGVTDVVILERGYPGGGATGRNVARIRAMQLTEELTHVARACQDKYDRMGEELALQRPVLPAWLRVGAVRGRRGRADAADRRDAPPHRRPQPLSLRRRDSPPLAGPSRRRRGRGGGPQRRCDRPPRCRRVGSPRAPGTNTDPGRPAYDRRIDREQVGTAWRPLSPTAAVSLRGPSSTPQAAGRPT